MSVCWLVTYYCFDTVKSYLAHGSITMRVCVSLIHNPDTTVNFDLKVSYIGVVTYLLFPHVISVCFDISIPYLAHWSIIMRECVTFIHDPNTFDLEVKFIEFLTWLCVWATAFLPFVIVIPILAYECITMEQCVTYTLDLCMTLTCGLYIKNIFSP